MLEQVVITSIEEVRSYKKEVNHLTNYTKVNLLNNYIHKPDNKEIFSKIQRIVKFDHFEVQAVKKVRRESISCTRIN